MKLTHLAVHHEPRDVDGTRLEAEQQVVDQIGHAAVTVQLGTPDFVGGVKRVSATDAAIATRAAEIAAASGGRLLTARLERTVSATTAIKEATETCFNCKHWDLEAAQTSKRHPHGIQGVEDTRVALSKGYLESGLTNGMAPAEALAEAGRWSRSCGVCRAMHDENGKECYSPVNFRCHKFSPRNIVTRRLMAKKYDEILHAAGGGRGVVMVSAASGSGVAAPAEKK